MIGVRAGMICRQGVSSKMGQDWASYPVLDFNKYATEWKGGDTPHYAYDVQTPFHTPVTAPIAGTIDHESLSVPWGSEIFIKPDDPNILGSGVEYYFYHLDTLDEKAGDHLSAGQEIGLSGGENTNQSYPGQQHPASPVYSSGPHTHFGEFSEFRTVPNGPGLSKTIPYGPDPSNLFGIAQGLPSTGNAASGLTSISGAPGGVLGGLGITNTGLTNLAVGAIGVALVLIGAYEIAQVVK